MKRINILDENTSNKIAAGEVVERPSSVIKELLENSIDAESKNIMVEIEEGGEKLIKLVDDGNGIHPDDIEKVFMPHATSKISTVEDIYNISTLGFRGEALSSIGAVAKVTLTSRIADNNFGVEVSIAGGKIEYIKEVGCNVGTTIEVRDLFYNVPARKKFLKSTQREAALIGDIVSKIALSNTKISFSYYNNGKKALITYGNGRLIDNIRSIYGKTIAENCVYFESHRDIISTYGYIGTEEISRKSRNNQSIFINNRFIKNKTITAAVENAYKSFLTINRHPFFIVFIDIFPEYIDVNIHPTKAEVKFEDERIIYSSIFNAVHNKLREHLEGKFYLPEEKIENQYIAEPSYEKINFLSEEFRKNNEELITYPKEEKSAVKIYENNYKEDINNIAYEKVTIDIENLPPEHRKIELPVDLKGYESYRGGYVSDPLKDQVTEVKEKIPNLTIIGQYNKTYILAEYNHELYIIDQHAAHEKIYFEKYRKEIREANVIIQGLLTPCIIELNYEDYAYYIENKEIFMHSGFDIEEFGENTISIREVPYVLGKLDVKNTFVSMLDDIKNFGQGKTNDIKYDRIATMACKSAIKANDELSLEEMTSLVRNLSTIEEPFTCPHGRPTIIKISNYELEKKFKRVQ
ncbi:DNA mismatch repair endonuclease MutL [Clostridium amazonitimonense]|uniref:DNA mismatch repair endonuclease MutL n=1 Tax=Clostridium amazonitimonense TaxID=1499689 RepID=UPI000509F234|nr:DNA mismatch repair endonuclease MutL [Clostridium amazonitimonense]